MNINNNNSRSKEVNENNQSFNDRERESERHNESEYEKNSNNNTNISLNEKRSFKDSRFNNLAKKLNSLVDKSINNNINKSMKTDTVTLTSDSKIYYENQTESNYNENLINNRTLILTTDRDKEREIERTQGREFNNNIDKGTKKNFHELNFDYTEIKHKEGDSENNTIAVTERSNINNVNEYSGKNLMKTFDTTSKNVNTDSSFKNVNNKIIINSNQSQPYEKNQENEVNVQNKINLDQFYNEHPENNNHIDISVGNVESLLDSIEDTCFQMFKDQELKINLLNDEVDFIIKAIEQEKEESENLKRKIDFEIKNTEGKTIEEIQSHRLKTELVIANHFSEIEKMIFNYNNNIDLNEDEFQLSNNTELIRKTIDPETKFIYEEVNRIKENIANIDSDNLEEVINEINEKISICNSKIKNEREDRETNEEKIIIQIEEYLKKLKEHFYQMKYSGEEFEERIFKKLEISCTNLVNKFGKES